MTSRAGITRREWKAIEAILDAALEVGHSDRAALLEKECGRDIELRRNVEEFLAACDTPNGFLETPAAAFAAPLLDDLDSTVTDTDSQVVGPYRLLREIARGGMGTVFLAERADGQFDQLVALKLIKRGMDSDEIHRRFIAERQILARLNHPHIARLLDGGVTPAGQPWFAMEFIDGATITRHCDSLGLDADRRLGLFDHVCSAVRYAHQNLIVHRDLKPSNILVTSDGTVKLLDFGIAKLLDDTPGDNTRTGTGLRAMTPEYAAPEQVRVEPITTATDVYALGAVLYEMLTGRRAHSFSRHTPLEIERVICETDPAPPGVATDLDTIVLKALRKDPARRYQTVDALMEDLDRYRAGLPVRARPDTIGYRTKKFLRRNKIGVTVATALTLSVLGGASLAIWQAGVARQEAARASEVKDFLVGLFAVSDPFQSRGREITARELLDRGATRIDSALAGQPELQADLLDVVGGIYYTLGHYPAADSLYSRSVSLSQKIFGSSDPRVAGRLTSWAAVLQVDSRYDSAETLLHSALAIREKRFGRDHPEIVTTLEHLANVKRLKADFSSGEKLYQRALAIRRAPGSADSLMVATNLRLLGLLYYEAGRMNEADSVCQMALRIERSLLDPDHPALTRTLRNLTLIKHSQGRLADAELLGREVLAKRQKLYPDGHPDLANSIDELASVLETAGTYAEAESLFTKGYEMRLKVLGKERVETMNSVNSLSFVRWRLNDLDSAERLSRKAVAGYESLLPLDHRLTMSGVHNLGLILRDRGEYPEAERLLRRAIAGRRLRLGPRHPSLGHSLRHLGILLERTGRAAEAEQVIREALTIYRAGLSPRHMLIAEALTDLGGVVNARGRPAEAEPMLREALSIGMESFRPADMRLARIRRTLAATLANRRRSG